MPKTSPLRGITYEKRSRFVKVVKIERRPLQLRNSRRSGLPDLCQGNTDGMEPWL